MNLHLKVQIQTTMGEYVSPMCVAIDEEESSIRKKDSMKYSYLFTGSFMNKIHLIHYAARTKYIVIDS